MVNISVGLRLVAKICERHLCVCCEKMLSKFLKCSSILVPSLKNIDIFIAIVYDICKIISSFPSGSGLALVPMAWLLMFLKDLILSLMEVLGSSF